MDKREPLSRWEMALCFMVGGRCLQGLSLGQFCSISAISWAGSPPGHIYLCLLLSFEGQQAESTGKVPEVASWTRKNICFGVRQTSIEILSPPQPALASWQVTLPISEKDVQGNHLTGLLGEGRV